MNRSNNRLILVALTMLLMVLSLTPTTRAQDDSAAAGIAAPGLDELPTVANNSSPLRPRPSGTVPTMANPDDLLPAGIIRDPDGSEYVANELVASFRPGVGPILSGGAGLVTTDAGLQQIFRANGVIGQRPILPETMSVPRSLPPELANMVVLTLADGYDVRGAAKALSASPAVYFAEPNFVLHTTQSVTPNDTFYALYQYGLNGTYGVRAPAAWAISTGASNVTIAVLDSGIDQGHPDLTAKHAGGSDFVNDDNDPNDDNGHGTHVAGIAAASTNNGRGIAGVSWASPVLSYKVCNFAGSCVYSDVIAAVQVAASDYDVKVINLSLGGQGTCGSAMQAAFDFAYGNGVTVVAAAGNDSTSSTAIPASCNHVIAVGSTTSDGTLSYFSNFGSWVDVVAPGSDIASTFPNDRYVYMSGTSMASPFVAGVVALIYAGLGNDAAVTSATVDRVEEILFSTSSDLGNIGKDNIFGYGLVDAAAAVAEANDGQYEPNNSAAAATSMTPGQAQRHSIAPAGDTDWMTFTLAQQSSVNLATVNSTASVTLELLNASQQQLACTPVASTNRCVSAPLPAGTYYVRASEPGNDASVTSYVVCLSLGADCAPTITSISPVSAKPGDTVTIVGTNLVQLQGVSFNGVAATDFGIRAGLASAVVPIRASSGKVSVTTLGGTATSAGDLTVTPQPTISSFTPANGLAGTVVSIYGTNLDSVTAVAFNGMAAGFSAVSATEIRATVPDGATSGRISATAPGGTALSSNMYFVTLPDIYEPNDSGASATLIALGSMVSHTTFHIYGDQDIFIFNGTIGQQIVAETDAVVDASYADTEITLYKGDGTFLARNDDQLSPSSYDSYLVYTLPATGSYLLKVTEKLGRGGEDYFYRLRLDIHSPPTITSFNPTSGLVGAAVTINGTNLSGTTAVSFNDVDTYFTVGSDTQVIASVPIGAATGKIKVTNRDGTATSSSNFTVIQPPTITSFVPALAGPGMTVTINGLNLTGATAVSFNGAAGTNVSVVSAIQVTAKVPSGATTGPISLTTPNGTATSSSSFIFVPAPIISSFNPTGGPIGTVVTINGTNLNGTTAVNFGSRSASFTQVSSTQLTAVVPLLATTGPISVVTPGGTATSSSNFNVGSLPTISSISPTSGSAGTLVTINGSNLGGATGVTFNGAAASFTQVSSSRVTATAPVGVTSGPIRVTTAIGTAGSSSFTVVAGPPTISGFSPSSGAVGATIKINGANLIGVTTVKFGTKTAQFTPVSETELTATVPSGAKTGKITVTTPSGSATSTGNFTVVAAPTISKLTPTSGTIGARVSITGKNLSGATVKFNNTTATVLTNTATKITVTVPAGATTGKISVTTAGGTASSATNFTVR